VSPEGSWRIVMIRHAFIVVCVTATVATVFAGALSHYGAFMFSVRVTPGHVVALHFFDARVRFFSIRSVADPIEVRRFVGPDLHVYTPKYQELGRIVAPLSANSFAWMAGDDTWREVVTIRSRRAPSTTEVRWHGRLRLPGFTGVPAKANAGYVRLPYWLIAGITALPFMRPITANARRRWRIRRGLCEKCAYNLTGNITGVCPECGKPILPQSTIDIRQSRIRA